jgi:hypothetical protein
MLQFEMYNFININTIVCFQYSKALLGLCLDGLGMFYLSHGRPEKAVDTLENALEVAKEVLGGEDDQVSQLLLIESV